NIYQVPSGGGKLSYNANLKEGKLNIVLGVLLSSSFEGKEFTVDVIADHDATKEAVSSGEILNAIPLPEVSYSLPSKVDIHEKEGTFNLSIDSATIINNLKYLGSHIVLVVRIKNPTKYEINEEANNSTVVIDIDVDAVNDLFFEPLDGFLYRKGGKLMLNG